MIVATQIIDSYKKVQHVRHISNYLVKKCSKEKNILANLREITGISHDIRQFYIRYMARIIICCFSNSFHLGKAIYSTNIILSVLTIKLK